ncbi:MAG: hypothetical protein ABFC63_09845 [Thermoguttaceae bacterium]
MARTRSLCIATLLVLSLSSWFAVKANAGLTIGLGIGLPYRPYYHPYPCYAHPYPYGGYPHYYAPPPAYYYAPRTYTPTPARVYVAPATTCRPQATYQQLSGAYQQPVRTYPQPPAPNQPAAVSSQTLPTTSTVVAPTPPAYPTSSTK